MVAGMLTPLDNLRAIYERLFRDGVMVAKKDKRPQTKHPEIPGVGNLQVIRAMGSLKSRGFVRETFAWRHFYWYLTNEGIVYLRDYLHLPPEIVPTPLQRVRRPAATLSIVQKAARVQTVEGPTSYVSKPGRAGAESQEALLERQGYRHRRMQTEEEAMPSEKTSRFRGRPITVDYSKSKAPGESRDQVQSMFQGDQGLDDSVKKKITTVSHQPPAKISNVTSLVQRMSEGYKGPSEASLIKNTPKTMELPARLAVTAETVAVTASMSTSKAVKPKEESIKATKELIDTKTAKDITMPPKSKEQVEQTLKVTKTKNIQEHSVKEKMSENTKTCISIISPTPQPVELKTVTKETQETIISKPAKDAHVPPFDKGQMEKSQKVSKIKNIQEHPVKKEIPQNMKTYQEPITSELPKDVSLSSHSITLVEKTLKVTESQNVTEHPVKEKISKNTETSVSISSTSTVPQTVELKAEIKTSPEPESSNQAKDASVIPFKKQVKVAETKKEQEHPVKNDMPKNAEMCISTTATEPVDLKAKSKVSQDVIISEAAKEASVPLSSKKQVEKTVKVTKTKNIQKDPAKDEMTKNTETYVSTSSTCTFQMLESTTKATQELVTIEPPKDASIPPQSKKQEGKSLKVAKTKSSLEHLVKDEMPENKETNISKSASSVQELKAQTQDVPVLDPSEKTKEIKEKDDTDKSLCSAVTCVSKTNKDTTVVNDVVDFVKEKAEVCLVQQTSEASLEEQTGNINAESAIPQAAPLTVETSNVQKSKKSQKKSSIKETNRDTQMASKEIKPVQVNDPKEKEIPSQESSITVFKTESKLLKHDTKPVLEISDAAAVEQVKEVIMHEEIKVVTKHQMTSVQQIPPSVKLFEESEAKDLTDEAAVPPKALRRKKKKQTAADKQAPSSEISAAEEMVTTQTAVKIHPNQGSEPIAISESSKICSEESSQIAAVHSEAPIHKGEVEPTQPSAEKIKREVLKGKTSSSQQPREAPTAEASAATQAGPYPEHGEPPSVAQHLAAPDTHSTGEKQKVLSVSKAIQKPVTTGPLSAEEKQVLSEDEAAMRKKIVVVEEVVEVQQQIATPGAEGSQPVAPPVAEIPGDDLDYDVLEELAKERAVFQSPVKEVAWDHSLDEPEPKTFPNFIEGRVKNIPSCACVMPLPPSSSVGGSVWLVVIRCVLIWSKA